VQLQRTYHWRRTLRKTKTARKAPGNHRGKYVIRETEYAAASFCGVGMPSWPLTWSITPRHDIKKCHKPAGNSRSLERLERIAKLSHKILYYEYSA